jgi:hypothetical protein
VKLLVSYPSWRLCGEFPALLCLCDPTPLPQLYESQIVKELGKTASAGPGVGSLRFSHFDKSLNVFIVVFFFFCIFCNDSIMKKIKYFKNMESA